MFRSRSDRSFLFFFLISVFLRPFPLFVVLFSVVDPLLGYNLLRPQNFSRNYIGTIYTEKFYLPFYLFCLLFLLLKL